MPRALVCLPLVLACGSGPDVALLAEPDGPGIVIDHVRIFDGQKVIEDGRVVIESGRIAKVGPAGGLLAPGSELIDGRGKTVLPGLIDAHTHTWDRGHLEQALVYGVTMELDMFNLPDNAFPLAARDDPGAASLRSAGMAVTVAGGHGTQFGLPVETLASAADAEAFVAKRVSEGSHHIKLIYDDLSAVGDSRPTLTREALAATIEAAHAQDKLAVVHVSDRARAVEAVSLGADGLVHVWVDGGSEEAARQIAKSGAFVIPTISVLTSHCDGVALGAELAADEALARYASHTARLLLRDQLEAVRPPDCERVLENVRALHRAGVTLLAGTDAPNAGTAHGIGLHGELALLVRAGLSPAEALGAATRRAAEAFKLEDRGRIAPGARADLLLVEGDPTTDIEATRRIVAVWKEGVRLDRSALAERWAAQQPPYPKRWDPESGEYIAGFEGGTLESTFGAGLHPSSDAEIGGSSTVATAIVEPGAADTTRALAITGEVVRSAREGWAGVNLFPGAGFDTTMDLSAHRGLSLWARGDGRRYAIMLFTSDTLETPAVLTFTAGPEWKEHRFAFRDFRGADPRNVAAFFIGSTGPGTFRLAIDELSLF